MPQKEPERLQQDDLQPGDVLLHSGTDAVAQIIQWGSDSDYCHAALVYDKTHLVESGSKGIYALELKTRLAQTQDYQRIDVYRFERGGKALDATQIQATLQVANAYLGGRYPVGKLVELGLTLTLRTWLPQKAYQRLLLRLVLDLAVKSDPRSQVCSEYVWRSFAEAKVQPSLAPEIVVVPHSERPFPAIDWEALREEFQHIRGAQHGDGAANASPAAAVLQMHDDDSDAALMSLHDAARRQLGVPASAGSASQTIVDPMPNPRLITPGDLANSPDFRLVGSVLG
jgi:hypothetical protein